MNADPRKRQLAKIHIARNQIGMDDETYRAMLQRVAGIDSAGDASPIQLGLILRELARLGWTPKGRGGRSRAPSERAPLIRKIKAMLHNADRPDAYADAMADRMFQVQRYEWCNPDQLRRIVAALVYDAKRHGRPT